VRLLRPPWPDRPDWVRVPDSAAAAAALPPGARVLLTSGRKDIAPFAARTDTAFLLRTIEEVPGLPPHIRPLLARPPFTLAEEEETMRTRGITHLVTKNAGGAGTAKLDAAERLGVTTIVIDRLKPPPGSATTIEAAMEWLRAIGIPAPGALRDDGSA
jgi:precorrin-6A/cobalt-precorrin-6A reductase